MGGLLSVEENQSDVEEIEEIVGSFSGGWSGKGLCSSLIDLANISPMSSCLALATFLLQYFVPFSCCFRSSELITLLACLVEAEAVRHLDLNTGAPILLIWGWFWFELVEAGWDGNILRINILPGRLFHRNVCTANWYSTLPRCVPRYRNSFDRNGQRKMASFRVRVRLVFPGGTTPRRGPPPGGS